MSNEAGAGKALDAVISLGGEARFSNIQSKLGVGSTAASEWLDEAKERGFLERIGEPRHRGTYWRVTKDRQEASGERLIVSSARELILKILDEEGPQEDDHALMEAMVRDRPGWRTLGYHSLDHQLFSMEKAGLIEMKVTRDGSVQRLTKIRLPKRPASKPNGTGGDLAAFYLEETPAPEPDPIPSPSYPSPTYYPETVVAVPQEVIDDAPQFQEAVADVLQDRFPILNSLQALAIQRDETNRRADAFLSAASALDGVAQEESDRLMALAHEIAESIALTPVESEYLRFADYFNRMMSERREEGVDALLAELREEQA